MKSKIIAIFSIMVLIVSVFSMSVSADIVNYPFPNCADLIDGRDYVLQTSSSGIWYLIVAKTRNKSLALVKSQGDYYWADGEYHLLSNESFLNGATRIKYDMPTCANMYDAWRCDDGETWVKILGDPYVVVRSSSTLYYSSIDIYKHNYIGSVPLTEFFFQRAPLIQTTLLGALREVRFLIPYLVLFLIGFLAFWKGWQFLSMQLRKA